MPQCLRHGGIDMARISDRRRELDVRWAREQLEHGYSPTQLLQRLIQSYNGINLPEGYGEGVMAQAEQEQLLSREVERAIDMLKSGDTREQVKMEIMSVNPQLGNAEASLLADRAIVAASRDLMENAHIWDRKVLTKDNCDWVTSWDYIRENFQPGDRVALVFIRDRGNGQQDVQQRFMDRVQAAGVKGNSVMKALTAQGYNAYIAMNTIAPGMETRRLDAIQDVRHLYLDLDTGGREKLKLLMEAQEVPKPNYVLNTSPEKYQVVWKVDGFDKPDASEALRALQEAYGGDPAAKDLARVFRIPGFQNRKYPERHVVMAARLREETAVPHEFDIEAAVTKAAENVQRSVDRGLVKPDRDRGLSDTLSQSERDWAYARKRAAMGHDPADIKKAMMDHREGEKRNEAYYANRTVDRAWVSVQADAGMGWEEMREVIRNSQILEHPGPGGIEYYLAELQEFSRQYSRDVEGKAAFDPDGPDVGETDPDGLKGKGKDRDDFGPDLDR